MTAESLWMLAFVGGVSAGAGLLAWGGAGMLSDLWRALRRLRPLSLSERLDALSARPPALPEVVQAARTWSPQVARAVGGAVGYGVAGALLARDWLLSPYLLALGLALGYVLSRLATRPDDQSKPVALLLDAFRSQYAVHHSTFSALAASVDILPPSPVRRAVEAACAYNGLARPDPLAPLREVRDETLAQFVRALEVDTTPDAMQRLLKELSERIKARRRVREAAEGALVLFMGTVIVLVGANLLFALVVLVVPLMRQYFVAQMGGRLLYVALTLTAALGGAYFLLETRATEEQLL
jgi:hypothetical protein